MQASLIITSIYILTITLDIAAAAPQFDFIPSWDWITGEPTVLDPYEQSLEGQTYEQDLPFNLDPGQFGSADSDPSMFEATPLDPASISPIQPDPFLVDPNSDPNTLDPALLDPNDPESPDMSRPNCGTGTFGPNVPLCCNGLKIPGGSVVSGCKWYDRGKQICKNKDNVVCCQYMTEGFGFGCWQYY